MIFANVCFAQSDASLYRTAKEAVAAGDNDYAFMCFRSLLDHSLESRYHKQALFSTGEYWLNMGVLTSQYTPIERQHPPNEVSTPC